VRQSPSDSHNPNRQRGISRLIPAFSWSCGGFSLKKLVEVVCHADAEHADRLC
jgi:hypothetical protein